VLEKRLLYLGYIDGPRVLLDSFVGSNCIIAALMMILDGIHIRNGSFVMMGGFTFYCSFINYDAFAACHIIQLILGRNAVSMVA
jgi:hypothetical protein